MLSTRHQNASGHAAVRPIEQISRGAGIVSIAAAPGLHRVAVEVLHIAPRNVRFLNPHLDRENGQSASVEANRSAHRGKRHRLSADLRELERIVCSPVPDPSRAERRRQYQSSHPVPPRNLGVIEGERLQRSRGYHEDYSLAKNLASLAAVTAILFCAAVVMGAL